MRRSAVSPHYPIKEIKCPTNGDFYGAKDYNTRVKYGFGMSRIVMVIMRI